MKIAYFDCSYGISGDMFVGALLSAGAPFEGLERQLRKLALEGVRISGRKVARKGLAAIKFDVNIIKKVSERPPLGWPPLGWKEMSGIVKGSALPEDLKKSGLGIIKSLFDAEAKVHGLDSAEEVHLHELGSADTIVDVMGALICLKLLNVEEVYSSPVNLGGGMVSTQHGRFGVPAPATALLLEGAPVYGSLGDRNDPQDVPPPFELTTPTGAALIKGLSSGFFSAMPRMRLEKSGAGAGGKDPENFPNVLRVFIGEAQEAPEAEEIMVMETNIDDMNPQIYGYLLEELLKTGALDAFLTPIIMKKGRPAIKLTVLCEYKNAPVIKEKMFRETTTLGVRFYPAGRSTLERKIETIETEFGRVRFKVSTIGGKTSKAAEYDDCKKIAKKTGLPLKEVMERIKARHGFFP